MTASVASLVMILAGCGVIQVSGNHETRAEHTPFADAPDAVARSVEGSLPLLSRIVKANPAVLLACTANASPRSRLLINILPGRVLEAEVNHFGTSPNGSRTWFGTLSNKGLGRFGFALQDGALVGFVQTDDGKYHDIRPASHIGRGGDGLLLISERGPGSFDHCGTDAPVLLSDRAALAGQDVSTEFGDEPIGCDEPESIDLMVVYSNVARQAAGSTAAMEARIALFVDDANLTLNNSNVDLQFRLVHVQEVTYDEANAPDPETHLERLAAMGDGYLDDVHALRDLHRADLVSLVVEDPQVGGLAFYPDFDSSRGFSLVRREAHVAILTHELGHNLGCAHDPGNVIGPTPTSYGYGYRFFGTSGQQWRTVMAYGPGILLPYFSNPNLEHDGVPLGRPLDDPQPAYNALAIKNYRKKVANYRLSGLTDCNANGIPDSEEIASGTSADTNANGVPDECEHRLYVSQQAPPDGDGLSWATAINDVQRAMDVASLDCYVPEIWIAEGTYTPAPAGGSRSLSFNSFAAVKLIGGFAGDESSLSERDWNAHPTILSGDLNRDDGPGFTNRSDNSFHVLVISNSTGPFTLDGLFVRGGNADGTTSVSLRSGGAVFSSGGKLSIRRCVFESNQAYIAGAAIYVYRGSASMEDCVFSRNSAGFKGGAVALEVATSLIEARNCSFIENFANNYGGAIFSLQSAISTTKCEFLRNTTFTEGTASTLGGAIYTAASTLSCEACRFDGNRARWGGAVHLSYDTITPSQGSFASCRFIGNRSLSPGGAIVNWRGTATILNSTFVGNSADVNLGRVLATIEGATSTTANTIMWSNGTTSQVIYDTDAPSPCTYCDIEGGRTGTGNINANPLFIRAPGPGPDLAWGTPDDDYGDVRLQSASPCIDAGNNSALPPGNLVDLAGSVRILDHPGKADTGNPSGAPRIVDMGAYEYVPHHLADFDHDGDVDAADSVLLRECGSRPAMPHPLGCESRDFDADGDVDQTDYGRFQPCMSGSGIPADLLCIP